MHDGLSPLERQQLQVADDAGTMFWHRVRFELLTTLVRQTGQSTVLDIGAGSGLLGRHLRDTGIGYRFEEASPSFHARLVELFGDAAATADDEPIGAGTTVALLDVIEHVDDDEGLLRSIRRRLPDDGRLFVTVPAMPWLFSSWDRDLGHLRRYRVADLVGVARRAGFDVIETGYLFPELVPPALVRRLRTSDGTEAEFPEFPRWLDRVLLSIARFTTRFRRVWPAGTSVVLHARPAEVAP